MKLLSSVMLLVLLLGPWMWGLATGGQVPEELLRSDCDAASCNAAGASPGACGSSQKYQVKPESETPWILVYVPVRSCHRVLKDKHGEFSPPAYHGDSPINFWCDWTVWAGSRKHIIVYIQGFVTKEDCNKNEDKILFEGVSSLVENSVVYACWKKETHVFATFAQAVHVVLLKRYLPGCSDTQFKGKYYIFQGEGEYSSKDDVISETPAPKLPKQDSIFQSGWSENLRDVLRFASTRSTMSLGKTGGLSGELMQQTSIALGTMAMGSPVDLDTYGHERTPLLETKDSVLGTELPGDRRSWQEAQGRTPEGIIPTAAQDSWRQSLPVSGDVTAGFGHTRGLSSVLLETPLLSALRVAESFVQPAGVDLENSQSVLHPSLRLKDLDNLQLTIKPTHASFLDLAAHSQPLSPGRKEGKKSTDTTVYQGLSTLSLENGESHPLLSVLVGGTAGSDADGCAKGLMPSLSSSYEVVNGDHSCLLPERYQSSFGDWFMTQPKLGTTDIPHLEAEPLSSIAFSPLAALDLDLISPKRGESISLARPGGQKMVSPSLLHCSSVASELDTDESRGCLGPEIQKLVLGEAGHQAGDASAPVDSPAGGPSPASVTSPKPGVGFLWPKDHMSSGSGVTQASKPGTWAVRREEHAVPVQHQAMAASNKLASDSILGGFKIQKTTEALSRSTGEQRNASSMAASNKLASDSILGGFKIQKTTEALSRSTGEQRNASSSATPAHPGSSVPWWGERALGGQKHRKVSDDPVSRNSQTPGGQQQNHAELGPPWTMEYFPIRSCHAVFQNGSGVFYLPLHADIKINIWCNWTILAGSQKHILIYVQGFQGTDGCSKNQDKIIFQGVLSSVETKVVYACHNRGTLIFAAQATAVHVLFLSGSGSLSHEYRHFKGSYYVFRDSETVGSSNDTIDLQEPVQEVSKKQSWRVAVTRDLLPMPRASSGPSDTLADGRIHPELESPDEEIQHPPDLMEDAHFGANLSKLDLNECGQLQDEKEMERTLKEDSAENRETKDDVLVEPSPAEQEAGHKAELSALEIAKGDAELLSALVTIAPCHSVGVPSSETASSSVGLFAKSSSLDEASDSLSEEAVAAAHPMQSPVLEGPPLSTSTKPSPLYPSPSVTAEDVMSPGERIEDLFDLVSLENGTVLQSQHHPGDVLFEVTIEIKPKDWISHVGSERYKSFLESMKKHIQENLKLSPNRVNDIKLKEIKRTSDANLLLTFWLHLKPEERNVSLLLRSQLEELLGTSVGVEKLQLVSLFVEDVNECSTGVGLCGEEAECFNSVGTYLCRCKKDYEDHSPTKSGTHCIQAPRSGIGSFLRHADILVGAAIMAALVMLVAAGTMCMAAKWRQHPRRNPSPEEPAVRAAEEPVMELHDLEECLRLDPFQLKLRARPPEWLWGARAHPGQAYRVFLEQSSSL